MLTVGRFQVLALQKGYDKQIEKLKDLETNGDLGVSSVKLDGEEDKRNADLVDDEPGMCKSNIVG